MLKQDVQTITKKGNRVFFPSPRMTIRYGRKLIYIFLILYVVLRGGKKYSCIYIQMLLPF